MGLVVVVVVGVECGCGGGYEGACVKYPVAHVICMMPGVDVCSCVLRYITVCSIALMQYIHSMCDAVHTEYA